MVIDNTGSIFGIEFIPQVAENFYNFFGRKQIKKHEHISLLSRFIVIY
jgi:hypothetical protein